MPANIDQVSAYLPAIDIWLETSRDKPPCSRTFTNFNNWLMTHFPDNDRGLFELLKTDYPALHSLFSTLLDNDHYDQLPVDTVHSTIEKRTFGRSFRTTLPFCDNQSQHDTRLRRLCEFIVCGPAGKNKQYFPVHALLNSFFTYILNVPSSSARNTSADPWDTKEATKFEKLCFLLLLNEYSKSFNMKMKVETRVETEGRFDVRYTRDLKDDRGRPLLQLRRTEGLLLRDGKMSQRTGKVVQIIVRGWDIFARSMFFTSTDDMLRPYISYGGVPIRMEPIPNREFGYTPLTIMTDITRRTDTVTVPHLTFPGVTEQSAEIDRFFRLLAVSFLNDLRQHTFNAGLYDGALGTADHQADVLKFVACENRCPPRFMGFDKDIISSIQELRSQSNAKENVGKRANQTDDIQADSPHTTDEHSSPNSPIPHHTNIEEEFVQLGKDRQDPEVSEQEVKRRRICIDEAAITGHLQGVDDHRGKIREFLDNYSYRFSSCFRSLGNLTDNDSRGIQFTSSAQFIILDPPYNTRRNANLPNSEHDVLSPSDMDDVVQHIGKVLRPGGHGIIFCTIQQFPMWQQRLKVVLQKSLVKENEEDIENFKTLQGPAYMVESKAMNFLNAPNMHKSNPGFKSCSLRSEVEYAIHFKRNGLPFETEATMVNYHPFNYVNSAYPATANVIDNIQLPKGHEWVTYGSEGKKDNLRDSYRLRQEQKPVKLLMELVSRFTQPGDVVVDFFAGTFSTAMACLMLPKHRVFVGCERDAHCFKVADAAVIDRMAEHFTDISMVTDLNVPDDILKASAIVSAHTKYRPFEDPAWKAPPGLPQVQVFPRHVMSFISSKIGSIRCLQYFSSIPLSQWPPSLIHHFNTIHPVDLRDIEAAVFGVQIAPSTIKHRHAGLGLFAARSFSTGEVLCQYYGSLVYKDLEKEKNVSKLYGGAGLMGVSARRFRDLALQIKVDGPAFSTITNYRYGDRSCFIVPPQFCVASYMNNWQYEQDDEDYEKYKDFIHNSKPFPGVRICNVKVVQESRPCRDITQLQSPGFVNIIATKAIAIGEEVFCSYERDETVLLG